MTLRCLKETFGLTDVFAAGLAVFCVQRLEAAAAVRLTVFHDVPLTTQNGLAFKAGKVLHVPVTTFCFGAFVGENNLKERR